VITPEKTDLAFDAALFMRPLLPWGAEDRLELPVRAESDEARRLLPTRTAQNLFDGQGQIVVAQALK
jgi:hypothetical protein